MPINAEKFANLGQSERNTMENEILTVLQEDFQKSKEFRGFTAKELASVTNFRNEDGILEKTQEMAKNGLITRKYGEKRRVYVALTEKGSKVKIKG